jgi:hypothetical protein
MIAPIFVNEKLFDVHVATPSGAGRIIPPSFAAEGDYFQSSCSAGMPLRKLSENEAKKFNRSKILITINSTFEVPTQEGSPPNPTSVQQPTSQEEDKPKKSGQEGLAETISGAIKGLQMSIPTASELEKMSADQLVELAKKHNISGSGNRKDLINLLKKRLEAA